MKPRNANVVVVQIQSLKWRRSHLVIGSIGGSISIVATEQM
jgi:hypothetical protein